MNFLIYIYEENLIFFMSASPGPPRIQNVSYVRGGVEEDVEVVLLLLGAPAVLLQAGVLLAVVLRVPVLVAQEALL
jgi:hypothetical protein